MKKKTSSLTKSQKLVIILSLLYEIIIGLIASNDRYAIQMFVMLSLPCLLYWAGVWIWGFGYISKIVKIPFKYISNKNRNWGLILTGLYELVIAIISGFNYQIFWYIFITLSTPCLLYWLFRWIFSREKYIKTQKPLFRFLHILSLILFFGAGFCRYTNTQNIGFCIGYAVGTCVGGYIFSFCLASIITLFIKDKEANRKTSIILILLLSLFFFTLEFQSGVSDRQNKAEVKEQVLNFARKAHSPMGVTREDVDKIKMDFVKDSLNTMMNVIEEEFPKYMSSSGLEGIITEENKELLNSQKGIKQLYTRGKNIIEKIDSLDIPSDVNNLFSGILAKIKDTCSTKYSDVRCDNLAKGMVESVDNTSDKFVEFLENKRKLIHTEFSVIKCIYATNGKCEKQIDTYLKEEAIFLENSAKIRDAVTQYPIDKISSIDIDN